MALLFTDVTLVAGVDGAEKGMHRGVLAAASSVFFDAFTSGASLGESDKFTLPGKTSSDLELLQHCIYPTAR